ncbi:MAG: alanyl-tRNA editing protein [Polyangiaceae bacterium]|nr:alanyl-tRNA editing protein [Polyangiaceae bacterium]
MPPTLRLHHDDPLLLHFDALVLAHAAWEGAPSVILDRTAFYPESGGQMGDRGAIAGVPIVDTQVSDDGVVHHVLGAPPPDALAAGARVDGDVARARRRLHMALHTAQHMLSRALEDEAGAATVSARLGETACTLDVDQVTLDEARVARAEALVNAVIEDDLPVRQYFPDPAAIARLPLRRAPKVTENIRVVDIGGFDVSPCGGTHCLRTAQVGLVRVTAIERYKGKARVVFSAGRRAAAELAAEAGALRALARDFTCGPLDVRAAVDKLHRELAEAREALGHARLRVADALADELLARAAAARGDASGDVLVIGVVEDATVDLLRKVARRITTRPDAVALLAGRAPDGTLALVARGAASTFPCGAFLKRAATLAGGRGGGRPESAEGRLPADADWASITAAALAARD